MRKQSTESRMRGRRWAVLATAAVLLAPVAEAQEAAPQPPPVPKEKPGFFESVGRFFDQGATNFRDSLQGAKRRMDDLGDEAAANTRGLNDKAAAVSKNAAEVGKNAAEATKGAVDAMTKTRVMSGRERCTTAPNGAPDCVAAAEQLCRKHGYATGKSMDFTSAEECPAKVYLGGQQTAPECYTVTFISRAMCQ